MLRLPVGALDVHGSIEDREGDGHVRRVDRHAVVAGAEDGVLPVEPVPAAHPLPGSRLLHDENVVCMKYGQRVRCNRFPPAVAMLRSCVVAPLRIA